MVRKLHRADLMADVIPYKDDAFHEKYRVRTHRLLRTYHILNGTKVLGLTL